MVDAESASFSPVDDAKLADVVARRLEVRSKPHAFGDVIAQSPEVDDVAPGAKSRGPLDNRGLETGGGQPEGECRSGYPRA